MALKDVNGNPLVIRNTYRIRVKNEDMLNSLRSDQLRETYAHNKIGTLTELLTVGDEIPSGKFKLEDDREITLNNYDCTFTRCMDLTCSVSGGKRRTRRTRRTRRSKRRRSRRFA